MKIAEWQPIMERLGLSRETCTVYDDGLLWTGGLWLDKSYLDTPEKVEKILLLYAQRPGLFSRDKGEVEPVVPSSSGRSKMRLLRLKKAGGLLAEKWDMPLSPEEEIPASEWFRLLHHVQREEWAENAMTGFTKKLFISFQAFCPAYVDWRWVHFLGHAQVLQDEEDSPEIRAAKEKNAFSFLCSTFASHMRKSEVGIVTYESDENGNEQKIVTTTKTTQLRLSEVAPTLGGCVRRSPAARNS